MSYGIIYVMKTVVPGLIKIGKTNINGFENRMYHLERNGYSNVTGLKRQFAIAVDDYDEKEGLLHEIFSKSQVPNTELFALDLDLVIQLLSSFEGKQIYPETVSKEKTFEDATQKRSVKSNWTKIPNGEYYLSTNVKGFGLVNAKMEIENGIFRVLAGSTCAPNPGIWQPELRNTAKIENNILQEDVECNSPSTAAQIALAKPTNGWRMWCNKDGEPIDIYRK